MVTTIFPGQLTLDELAEQIAAEQQPGGPRLAALVIPWPNGPVPGTIYMVPLPDGAVREWVAEPEDQ